jgi:hypothetical protein
VPLAGVGGFCIFIFMNWLGSTAWEHCCGVTVLLLCRECCCVKSIAAVSGVLLCCDHHCVTSAAVSRSAAMSGALRCWDRHCVGHRCYDVTSAAWLVGGAAVFGPPLCGVESAAVSGSAAVMSGALLGWERCSVGSAARLGALLGWESGALLCRSDRPCVVSRVLLCRGALL